MRIGWSSAFLLLDGERPAAAALDRLRAATERWIVIVRPSIGYCYVFTRDEIFERLRRQALPRDPAAMPTFAEALDLQRQQASTQVQDSAQLAPPDLSWRPDETAPSARLDAPSAR